MGAKGKAVVNRAPLLFLVELPEDITFGEILELEKVLKSIGARVRRLEVRYLTEDEEWEIMA